MIIKSKLIKTLFVAVIFLLQETLQAQVAINGPACAISGGTSGVSYSFSGPSKVSGTLAWTVTGGVIVTNGKSSLSGDATLLGNQVRVIWNAATKQGKLELTCGGQKADPLLVNVVTIDSSISTATPKLQAGAGAQVTGGNPSDNTCVGAYEFWWESSDSPAGPFARIEGAAGKSLMISSLSKKTFYRRVFQANGNNFYSNVLTLDVDTPVK